jgi:hypothetical protein
LANIIRGLVVENGAKRHLKFNPRTVGLGLKLKTDFSPKTSNESASESGWAKNAALHLSFPYVCPKPVLVK